jgi:chemotaxis protein histidine kinase CheA/CheY-like chemotaxis protein
MRRLALDLGAATHRLEALLFGLRLVPASEAMEGLGAEAGALASRLGKQVRFELEDRDVRADRRTLQTARGMVRHLIRNAMDHGLEPPSERAKLGKDPSGALRVAFAVREGLLRVDVEDDGRGFDVATARQKLLDQGVPQARLQSLSEQEVLAEFVQSGTSTRDQATDISGRGLGLSAVVALARNKGGDFHVNSTRGEGATLSFTVPLDVYTQDVLTVRCEKQWYGLPMGGVVRSIYIGPGGQQIQEVPGGAVLAIDERIVSLVSLAAVLGAASTRYGRFAIPIKADGREVAFGVDDLGEPARVVPEVVSPLIGPTALISGVSLLADGAQLQILNPRRLLELARTDSGQTRAAAPPKGPQRRLSLLLAEDSLATREVLRVLLEREGYEVRVAGDGEEALARLSESVPDVVVSDFNMPRRDGLSLVRAIRASEKTKRLPVVLLTSKDDAASRSAGAAAGADAYLIKSEFNAAALKQTLRRLGVEG